MTTKTEVFCASGYDETRSAIASVQNLTNMVDDPVTSTSYAQFGLVTGSNAETNVYVTFDFSSIPADADIESVTGKIKVAGTGSATYVSERQVRGYIGTGTKGYSGTFSTSATTLDLDWVETSFTREQLDNLTLRAHAKRRTSNVTTAYYIRIYGAEITVTYSYEDTPEIQQYTKVNGIWVASEHSVVSVNAKTAGQWGQIDPNDISSATNYVEGAR